MHDAPVFLLGDTIRHLQDVAPTLTVLDYLRTIEKMPGTKEGCAEGDCGACTVVLGEVQAGDAIRYRAVNACVLFVPALDGKQLLTVEHLAGADGALHPVQAAMVDHHASQCGFCTPGFVMSLYALYVSGQPADRSAVNEALSGNLCRCTGYRPIVDAALASCAAPEVRSAATTALRLRGLASDGMAPIAHGGQTYWAPRSIGALSQIFALHPDAVLLAGGTDIGLWVTKQHRTLSAIIALDGVAGLDTIESTAETLMIGATARYEEVMPALGAHYPDVAALFGRIGSRQIRNRGTLGGNIGNASPIGDTPPALIALGAAVVLRQGDTQRSMPLEAFFLGYRTTALRPGEFIERIDVPLPRPNQAVRCYKVAKRFDQDISAVCAAFSLELAEGVVTRIRIGFGGMAATPMRAERVEQALLGQQWTEAVVMQAMTVMDSAFIPLSDPRASANYRARVARNLLFKFFLETSDAAPATRLTVPV